MRFGCLGFLFALFLTGHAFVLLRDDIALRDMVTTSMPAFERQPRTDGWLRVTGAHLDFAGGIITGTSGKHADPSKGPTFTDAALVPLRSQPVGEDEPPPAKLYLKVTDRAIVDALERLVKTPDAVTDADRAQLKERVSTVEGLLEPASAEWQEATLKGVSITPDTPVLRDAEAPRPWYLGVVILLGGLAILTAIVLQIARLMRKN